MRRCNFSVMFMVCLFFPLNIKADDFVSVLYYPDSITFTSEQLVQMHDGIYVSNENKLTSLEQNERKYNLPTYITDNISDIITTGESEIIRTGKDVYLLNDTLIKLMSLDKENIRMFPFNSDFLFISYKESGVYHLCTANSRGNQITTKLNLPDSIVSVVNLGEKLFVTTEKNIYLFDDNGLCHNLLSAWEPFRSSVLTSCGLLIGTDNSISLVTDIETFIPLIKVGCKKMLYYGDYLYIYTPDNALLKINFKKLEGTTEIRNKAHYLLPSKVMIELR